MLAFFREERNVRVCCCRWLFQSYHRPQHRVGVFADQYHTGEIEIALGGEEVDILTLLIEDLVMWL